MYNYSCECTCGEQLPDEEFEYLTDTHKPLYEHYRDNLTIVLKGHRNLVSNHFVIIEKTEHCEALFEETHEESKDKD